MFAPLSSVTSSPELETKIVEMVRISLTYSRVPHSICLYTAEGMKRRMSGSSESLNCFSLRLSFSIAACLMVGKVYLVSSMRESKWYSGFDGIFLPSMTQPLINSQACGLTHVSPSPANASAALICSRGGPAMMYSLRDHCVSGGTTPPTWRILTGPQPMDVRSRNFSLSTPVSNMCKRLRISMQQAAARRTAVAMAPRSGRPYVPCGGTTLLYFELLVSSTAWKYTVRAPLLNLMTSPRYLWM
mmetsp:Transcript_88892/g.259800  ORF Transcript_88892/g.259800 Transcript_88892/m.259800 type:complete len:244 (+) Transcript_88892:2144-2875(+)